MLHFAVEEPFAAHTHFNS